jgi:hypothetical protein
MKNVKSFIAILTLSLALAATAFAQEEPTPTPETPADTTTSAEPKREGVTRLGLVMPKAQVGANQAELSASVQQLLASYLVGPTVETVPLTARTPAQINLEAQQKGCDFVLYTSLSQKQKTSLFGNLIKIAAPAVAAPMQGDTSNQGNSVGNVAQQSANNVLVAATAGSVKAKDIVTLEFSLVAVNAKTPLVKSAVKAKAKADGEDVLTPLVEQAATAITDALAKQ